MQSLENVRILDLTHVPPGQFCSMMLSDMGAEVVRVEQPAKAGASGGDATMAKFEDLMGSGYAAFNRNKRSITLNLRDEDGRAVLLKIAERMDVLVEGFRPGVAERLGIDYKTLSQLNPRLIYCSMSGFGQDGPYRDMPGHDINYVAIGGALRTFGDPPPVIPNFVADYAGATLYAVIGILLALMAREKTGRGQHVDISYTDGVVSLMTQFAASYLAGGDPDTVRAQTQMMFSNAGYGVYKTGDGKYLSLGCVEPWFWVNICQALGKEEFIQEFAKWEKHGEIRDRFAEVLLTKSRDEWFDLFKDKNIPVGKVYEVEEIFTDPQVLHRQMLVEIEDPKGGKQKQVGIPIKLSDTPGRVRNVAPAPGQNTEEVLLELGYTSGDIKGLSDKGAISLPAVDTKS
ncbi:CaiB/BaiF CoA transferase family protein [Chloroflexota bacterium]